MKGVARTDPSARQHQAAFSIEDTARRITTGMVALSSATTKTASATRLRRQASGKNADRPELAACLDYLRPGPRAAGRHLALKIPCHRSLKVTHDVGKQCRENYAA